MNISIHNIDSFWDRLIAHSDNFLNPLHFESEFEYTGDYEKAILKLISLYIRNDTVRQQASIRLYLDGQPRQPKQYLSKSTLPENETTTQEWANKHFPDQTFGLVFEKVEHWSDEFVIAMAKVTQSYSNQLSPEDSSFNLTLFAGNYGFTPFGAHIDKHEYLKALHFQLGPGTKTMTLWEPELFRGITGSEDLNCYQPAPYISKGNSYTLQTGDVFLLPTERYYHVGNNVDFSVSLALGIVKDNPQSSIRKALAKWSSTFPVKNSTIKEMQSSVSNLTIGEIVRQYGHKKKSNALYQGAPLIKLAIPKLLIGKSLVITSSFSILLITLSPDRFEVYARGYCWRGSIEAADCNLIQLLNAKETIKVTPEKHKPNTIQLITWLYNVRAIQIRDNV